MNLRSPWVAVSVVLVTIVVCVFGVHTELAQARRSVIPRTAHVQAPAAENSACGAEAGSC